MRYLERDFDLATLENFFAAWPESYCDVCNAIDSSGGDDAFEYTERKLTDDEVRQVLLGRQDLEPAQVDRNWLAVRCRVCGAEYDIAPPSSMPFERSDYMERLLGLARAATRFPPHTPAQ